MSETKTFECQICISCIKVINRVSCPYCEYTTCKKCVQNFLLSILDPNPRCMNPECKKEWHMSFVGKHTPGVFHNKKYREYRASIMLERQKSLLPAAQRFVEIENKKIKDRERINLIKSNNMKIQDKISDLNEVLRHNNRIIRELRNKEYDTKEKETIKHTIRCPMFECRGFLNDKYKCGICSTIICYKCREPKNEDHKCDPNNVETVKLLKKDTKPCPNCGEMIYKIDGCFDGYTEIAMLNGNIKYAKDITIGDELIGDDGNKRIVQQLFKGRDLMYMVTQHKGVDYIVNSKHELVLKALNHGIYTKLSDDKWKIKWFDDKYYMYKTMIFSKKVSMLQFKDTLKHNIFNIPVNIYINLPYDSRVGLYGIKYNNSSLTHLSVTPLGIGTYYGWIVDNNNRFILPDSTIVKNCDQMFCTTCHSAFSWKTGKIETGVIHNPHYFEIQKKLNNGIIPRNNREFRCGGVPPLRHLINRLSKYNIDFPIRTCYQQLLHIRQVVMDDFPIEINRESEIRLRVLYLKNMITEDNWKKQLKCLMKKHEKNKEINEVLTTYTNILADLFDNIVTCDDEKNITNYLISCTELRLYTNKQLYLICDRYKHIIPYISYKFRYYPNVKKYIKIPYQYYNQSDIEYKRKMDEYETIHKEFMSRYLEEVLN